MGLCQESDMLLYIQKPAFILLHFPPYNEEIKNVITLIQLQEEAMGKAAENCCFMII